jgi:hypothetical protein
VSVGTTTASVVAGAADLSALLDLSGPARGAISFVLVLLVGVGLLVRREAAVDRAVDLARDGSPLAVVYGVIAFGLLAFVGGYVLTQAVELAPGTVVPQVLLVLVGLAAVVLAGFGYTVLGTWLTEIEGQRRPWPGIVLGAVLSAIPWLVLPGVVAGLGWILLAAVGLGSVTRHWVHGERTVATEAGR